ncbi:VOC family protein [Sphingobium indicum]|uniref:VOC family protein n=1 Tax=Sphingobium indicum TaxID=332055 RepID=UPI0035EC340D
MAEAKAKQAGDGKTRRKVVPTHMAHFVVKTAQYEKMIDWYLTFFDGEVVFSNEIATFLTFDQEHHRVAIVNMPGLLPQRDDTAGVHHVAFSLASLEDLLENYKRLKDRSILPWWCVNHGPTTSMYYKDPDGSQVEFQTDNYETFGETVEFMKSQAYADNVGGVDFDPEEIVRQFEAGIAVDFLLKRPDVRG